MLAFKKLMFMSLLNFTLRGTTLKFEEFLIALGDIIDKASTAPTIRQKKVDTSALLESGVAAKDDSESSREEGDQRIVDIALQAVTKGQAKATGCARGPSWITQRQLKAKMQFVEERVHGRKATARMEAKEQRKVARATAGPAGHVSKQDTLQPRVQKAATRTCMPLVEEKK